MSPASTQGYGVVVYGDGTYPMTYTLGTENAVFVEDCTFVENRHCIASNNGSHYVFRSNTIINNLPDAQAIDAHGLSSWPVGSRTWEIYDNTLNNSVVRYAGAGIYGGDGVIFNNNWSLGQTPTHPVLLGCEAGAPNNQQINEAYIWNNTPVWVDLELANCGGYPLDQHYFTVPKPGYTSFLSISTSPEVVQYNVCRSAVDSWSSYLHAI